MAIGDSGIRSSDRWQGEQRRRYSVFRYGGRRHDAAPGSCKPLRLLFLNAALISACAALEMNSSSSATAEAASRAEDCGVEPVRPVLGDGYIDRRKAVRTHEPCE